MSAAPAVSIVERDRLGPIKCRPWCSDGTGHADAIHPDDQRCYRSIGEVKVTLRKLVRVGDQWARDWLEVVINDWHARPAVTVVDETNNLETDLTPAEARDLAARLLEAAEAADPST
jgi:hypothetical protein